ncbi:MAG: hypothetical protein ACPHXR_08435 [Flavicella sp.]
MKTVLIIATFIFTVSLTSCGSKRYGSDCGYTSIFNKKQDNELIQKKKTSLTKELKTIS